MKRVGLPLVLLLAACSATQLVYNQLDWFASWQAGKYVDLAGPSEALFEAEFALLWRWHRATQLALYARDLRELAEAAAVAFNSQQVEDFLARANAHVQRALKESLPSGAKVLQALTDTQVADLLERAAEKRQERIAEDAELTRAERNERATERFLKNLKRWLGSVSEAQERQVQEAIAARPFDDALRQRYAEQWAGEFATLLRARQQAEFADRLRQLMLDPQLPDSPALRQAQLENQQSGVRMLAALSATLSAKQRAHFQAELRGLAQDLDTLAAQAP